MIWDYDGAIYVDQKQYLRATGVQAKRWLVLASWKKLYEVLISINLKIKITEFSNYRKL